MMEDKMMQENRNSINNNTVKSSILERFLQAMEEDINNEEDQDLLEVDKLSAAKSKLNEQSFDNFYVGNSNRKAYEIVCKCKTDTDRSEGELPGIIFLQGPAGCGKTHLMKALTSSVQRKSENQACYVKFEYIFSDFLRIRRKGISEEGFREKYGERNVLCIDNVPAIYMSEGAQKALGHLLSSVNAGHIFLALEENVGLKELGTHFKEILEAEFGKFECIKIENPDEQLRIRIIKQEMEAHQIKLKEETIIILAKKLDTSARVFMDKVSGLVKTAKWFLKFENPLRDVFPAVCRYSDVDNAVLEKIEQMMV